MPSLSQDTLTEALKSAKRAKELLDELYQTQLPEEGEFNKVLINAYGDSIKLEQSIETCLNIQVRK